MGACCGKGAGPLDPDKAPYGPVKPKSAHDGDRTPSPIPAKKKKGKSEKKNKKGSVSEEPQEEPKEEVENGPEIAANKEESELIEPPVPAPRAIIPTAAAPAQTTPPKPAAPPPAGAPEVKEPVKEALQPPRDHRVGSDTSESSTGPRLSTLIPASPSTPLPNAEVAVTKKEPSPVAVKDDDVELKIVEPGDDILPAKTEVKVSSFSTSTTTTSARYEQKSKETSPLASGFKPYTSIFDTKKNEIKSEVQTLTQSVSSEASTFVKETKSSIIKTSEQVKDIPKEVIKSISITTEKDGDKVVTKTVTEKDGDKVITTKEVTDEGGDKTVTKSVTEDTRTEGVKPVEKTLGSPVVTTPPTVAVEDKKQSSPHVNAEKVVVKKTTITSSTSEEPAKVKDDSKPASPTSPTSRLPVFNRDGDSSPIKTVTSSVTKTTTTVKVDKQEALVNNLGEVLSKTVTTPIIANVVIANGEADTEEEKVETREAPVKSFSSTTSDSTADEEVNGHVEEVESVLHANLKKDVKALLVDLSAANTVIRRQHKFQANTRAKLQTCVERWLTGQDKEEKSSFRVIWGQPGIGKTCVAKEWCDRHASHIAAVHFFHHCPSVLDHNEPSTVILSLAHQFCDYFPNYPNMLPKPDKLEDMITNASVTDLWETLITEPLQSAGLHHNPDKSILIVIDSLEDCSHQDRAEFFGLLNNFHDSTPDWAKMMVTVNDDNQIKSMLEKAYSVELKNAADNLTDIKRYLRDYLSPFMDRISLDGGLTQLAKKTEGSFLCAYLYRMNLETIPKTTKIALREVDTMFPTGLKPALQEIFQAFFDHLCNASSERQAQNVYDTIIGMLVNVREPIHEDFIQEVTDLESDDILAMLSPVIVFDQKRRLSLCNRYIRDWLCSEKEAGQLAVEATSGRQQLQECCSKWLAHITGDSRTAAPNPLLVAYALKHAITHFTDVPRQQENVAKLLCSLKYIQQKLVLEDVTVSHVTHDYRHFHYQVLRDPVKLISLEEYMKRQPKLVEQIESYHKFVQERGADIKQNPDFALNIAANYPHVQRIKDNARVELLDKAWIEDLTTTAETQAMTKSFNGTICGADISPDGKTIAVVTKDDEYRLQLHFLNAITGERRLDAVDIKTLKDRVGLCTRFLSDNNNVFVGSLTSLVNIRGKVTSSGLDIGSVQMKEKYSIECCDVSNKLLACGVSTFPWGGRSLHMILFDLKSKKSTKTLEVLKFRFGGSAQFGIRCCALSNTEPLLCTCVKQTNKDQLKITIWSTTKWNAIHSVDIDGDSFTKCAILGDNSIICGGSVHIANKQQSGQLRSKVWQYETQPDETQDLNVNESNSIFSSMASGEVVCSSWALAKGQAIVSSWKDGRVSSPADIQYTVHGSNNIVDMLAYEKYIAFIGCDEVRIYNVSELDLVKVGPTDGSATSVSDVIVEGSCFLPKSDDILLSQHSTFQTNETMHVSLLNPKKEDLVLTPTPFKCETRKYFGTKDRVGQFSYFIGPGSCRELCATSPDGNTYVANCGERVKLWNKSLGVDIAHSLPTYDQLQDKEQCGFDQYKGLSSMVSPKDNIIGLVYGQMPQYLYIYDLRSKHVIKKIKLDILEGKKDSNVITDFTFLPHNGNVVTYHREAQRTLAFWNQRTGVQISMTECVHIAYAKASPASDRLAISVRSNKQEGELLLRNSDGKFTTVLEMSGTWLPTNKQSDVDFSSDGTILVGVVSENSMCRVWNAGNGEVLHDLDISLQGPTSVVGMLTNTHVLIYDERLIVVDIATGSVEAILPLDETMEKGFSPRGLRVSPKGTYVAGSTEQGQLKVFLFHNFESVRRKTTLQRMKSLNK